jgi:hypothetical protein
MAPDERGSDEVRALSEARSRWSTDGQAEALRDGVVGEELSVGLLGDLLWVHACHLATSSAALKYRP